MALKDLTSAQMLGVTRAWLTPGPQRSLIEDAPVLSGLVDVLERVHEALEDTLLGEAERAEYQRLSDLLAALDTRHDALARATWDAIGAAATLTDDAPLTARLLTARAALFPDGLDVKTPSLLEEVSRARRADDALHAHRDLLNSHAIGQTTLAGAAKMWLESAEAIERAWAERASLVGNTPTDSVAERIARVAWMRAVNAFSALTELAELPDSDALLATLHEAELDAMKRREG